MAPLMVELVVWMPESSPETQAPVVPLLCLSPIPVVVQPLGVAQQVDFCGPASLQQFCGLKFPAELSWDGGTWGSVGAAEPCGALWFCRGEAVLCGNNLSSFSLLPTSLAQLPPPLLSAAAWIWQQVCGPGLKWGLFIPGGGGPPSPRRSPAGLSDPHCPLMVPQVC